MTTDKVEDDNSAFVIYVPPNGGDKTIESCLRLGGGPAQSQQATTDENKTYQDAVAGLQTLSDLSSSTYHPTSGIALITPGTINLVAAKGVNVTSGTSYTNSTSGSSYNITQESGDVISASYSSKDLGWWATSSFNQASTVSVTTVPLQASITLAPSFAVSGPLTCTNNWGAMWNSVAGWSVSAQLARVVQIGWHTIVANAYDGSNNEYYTAAQASSTAAGFNWAVPVASNKPTNPLLGTYTEFDARQSLYSKTVNVAAIATDAIATAYALFGAIDADTKKPADVQSWLKAAEPIAIACTALNGLLWAAGLLLGWWVDKQTADEGANKGATTITMGGKLITLTTGELTGTADAAAFGAAVGAALTGAAPTGAAANAAAKGEAKITMTDESIILKFGDKVSVTLSVDRIILAAEGHNITVAKDGIQIAGTNVQIEGVNASINALQNQINDKQTGLAATNANTVQALDSASKAAQDAHDAQQRATALEKATGVTGPNPYGP